MEKVQTGRDPAPESWSAYFNRKLNKYSDAIANWCAAAMVLTGGATAFALWQLNLKMSAAFGIAFLVSLGSMVFISLRIRDKQAAENKRVSYVVSRWSLETLRAVAAPADLINCLEQILEKAAAATPPRKQLSVNSFKEDASGTWLGDLKQKLGAGRVADLQDLLAKYTYRENEASPKSDV